MMMFWIVLAVLLIAGCAVDDGVRVPVAPPVVPECVRIEIAEWTSVTPEREEARIPGDLVLPPGPQRVTMSAEVCWEEADIEQAFGVVAYAADSSGYWQWFCSGETACIHRENGVTQVDLGEIQIGEEVSRRLRLNLVHGVSEKLDCPSEGEIALISLWGESCPSK